jgi:hypothetical protein
MDGRKTLVAVLLVINLFMAACVYVVLPSGLETAQPTGTTVMGWTGIPTNIEKNEAGDLHIDLAVRNDTGEWSTILAAVGKPATLLVDGKSIPCETVVISSDGHRLAPGFQMQGYIAGPKSDPQKQMLYVECGQTELSSGTVLKIPYVYFNGPLDYYHQDGNQKTATMEISLDQAVPNLAFPVAEMIDGVVSPADAEFIAVNENVITLQEITRTDTGLTFSWSNFNPTKFPLKAHIGNPPVIGSDGVIYGVFEIMDLAPVPLTPANASAQWTTEIDIPGDVSNLYILLSVEKGNVRTYVNHAVDLTGY